ncbi:agmatinase [Enterovirga rhinocerotis]|uniref:Agmatinase n=1 Tax=Enterovirga rhinocerotis TaxID=1339210 RepID=A0A4R7BWX4_9HYPH|nr:agmatinase [Enterovirga rhinocerotis]TDR90438.1 agmatinase [Enterovirga rhinocerotis]
MTSERPNLLVPRFAGVASFMRSPVLADPGETDIAILGIPFDGGTTNRPGARHGPRAVRDQSTLMRRLHPVTKRSPFDLCRIGDLGDVAVNPVDVAATLAAITERIAEILAAGAVPLSVGGDHLVSLPILRAVGRDRPVGLVHVDAHSDTWDSFFGSRYTHSTPFRRAVEEGVLDPHRTIQIGIRGSMHAAEDNDWALAQGIRIVTMDELREGGIDRAIAEALRIAGGGPTYLSFDIDALDPAYAPGTGTPEIGGLTSYEAQRLVRGLGPLDLVAADLVEVSPPLDVADLTALTGASLLWEMLCLLADARIRRDARAERS